MFEQRRKSRIQKSNILSLKISENYLFSLLVNVVVIVNGCWLKRRNGREGRSKKIILKKSCIRKKGVV